MSDLLVGMSVAVDVSTSEADAGNRYFGTISEVMVDPVEKHGLSLLVQSPEPNFTPAHSLKPAAVVSPCPVHRRRGLPYRGSPVPELFGAGTVRSQAA